MTYDTTWNMVTESSSFSHSMSQHVPVLLQEVKTALSPKEGEMFVDGTLGGGGHSQAMLKLISPDGTFIGIDWDEDSIITTHKRIDTLAKEEDLEVDISLVQSNFRFTKEILRKLEKGKTDMLLLDLGFSSEQIFSDKGFSFQRDEPLVMRYDGDTDNLTAQDVVNKQDEETLVNILERLGEERYAERIARGIVKRRKQQPIQTTLELARVVEDSVPDAYNPRLHPATRTFMALRIFVNEELENLRDVLNDIEQIVGEGGRVAIISFHSLEDREVKKKFKDLVEEGRAEWIEKLAKPTEEEREKNPRSRSAKMRAIRLTS